MPFLISAGAALFSAVSAGLAAGGVTAFMLRLGGSLLLSAAASALMAPKQQQAELTSRTVTARSPIAPRDIVYGKVRKGGTIIFFQEGRDRPEVKLLPYIVTKIWGGWLMWLPGQGIMPYQTPLLPAPPLLADLTVPGYEPAVDDGRGYLTLKPLKTSKVDTNQLYLIVALAGHRVKSIGAIYFDGEEAVQANGTVNPRWAGRVRVEKALGDADQSAFPLLRADMPSAWTDAHRLRGVAAICLRLTFDNNVFPNGVPNITADIEGKDDILDPRTGLRGWTDNAALCAADYMAMPTLYSIGATIGVEGGLDADDLIEAANVCDELVPVATGGTEKRYTANGVLSLSSPPKALIEQLLGAMAGSAPLQAGMWSLRAGAWRAPSVAPLTLDDARGDITHATRISRSEQFNAVRGKFISPANDWQPDDFPAITSAVYLAEDKGERKLLDVDLPLTTSPSMAQRLAKILLESARRQQTLNWPGRLGAWRVGVGDVIPVTHPRRGWIAKPFELRRIGLSIEDAEGVPALVPDFVLRETSPLVYDWSATEEQIYAAAPRTALPSAFDIDPPGVPVVSEALYVTRDGTGVKAQVRLEWIASPSPYVAQYLVQARLAGGEWREIGRTADLALDGLDWTPGLWEFRVAALSTLGVASAWTTRAFEVRGLAAPPVALDGVTLQTAGGLAILKWVRSPDADVRIGGNIVIRHSTDAAPTWQASYSMDRVAGDQTIAVLPLKPGAYLLRAEDSSGQQGPLSIVTTSGAQATPFAPVAMVQADPVWSGTYDGTAVIDGALSLGGSTAIDSWGPVDAVADWDYEGGVTQLGTFTLAAGLDLGSVRNVRLRSDIGVSALLIADRIDARPALIDDWADFDGTGGARIDVVVEYRETDDDPAAAPVWSDWARVDSSEIRARAVQARAILSTQDAAYTVRVDRLRLYADEVA